jgi:hypothetical protein
MGKIINQLQDYANILQKQLDDRHLFAEKTFVSNNEHVYCIFTNSYDSGYYFWREHREGDIHLTFYTNDRKNEQKTIPGYITRFGLLLCDSITKGMSLSDYSNSIIV